MSAGKAEVREKILSEKAVTPVLLDIEMYDMSIPVADTYRKTFNKMVNVNQQK